MLGHAERTEQLDRCGRLASRQLSECTGAARRISGFADLDGLEFVARIDIGTDTNGEEKNEIRAAVTPDHKDYAALMGVPGAAAQPQAQPSQPSMPQPGTRPSWAK